MNDMTKTKCSFIIKVECVECLNVFELPKNTFNQEDEVQVVCKECKQVFIAKNVIGGVK